MSLRAAAASAVSLLAFVPTAVGSSSTPGFVVGFDDDSPEWVGAAGVAPATQVGAGAFRFTLQWRTGERSLTSADSSALSNAVPPAHAFRIVLAVYGASGADAPIDGTSRSDYCAYVADALTRFPSIRDVVIWNEPNKSLFWNPQSQAPAQYEALLASCYDSLHAAFAGVDVIGLALSSTGNDDAGSTSPGAFIRGVGDAYRASGRARPLLDTVAHHPYPLNSAERPWAQHIGQKQIAEGDWNKLMYNLWLAFNGTAQPLPGTGGVAIWYLEDGFQTAVPAAKAGSYTGSENVAVTVPASTGAVEASSPPPAASSPAPDQATQILDSVRLAACQPGVGAFFNFMLVDDTSMTGWQSGAFWADGSAKESLPAFQQAATETRNGAVDCGALKGGRPSSDFMPPSAPPTPTAQVQTAPLGVTLSWPASTDDSGGALSYRVFRNGGLVTTTTAPTWTNTGLADLTTYSYTVRALDTAGNLGDASPAVTVTTPDTTPPSTPLGLTAQVDATGSSVALAWQPATDNGGVTGYEVSRNGTVLGTIAGTTYTDATVTAGSSDLYGVVALDAAGNRGAAASATVNVPASAPPPSGGGSGGGGGGSTTPSVSFAPSASPAPVPTPAPVPALPSPTPAEPISTPAPAANVTAAFVLTLERPAAVHLAAAHPSLRLTLSVSRRASVAVTLVDAKRHLVARWHPTAHKGANTFVLRLPHKPVGSRGTVTVRAGGRARAAPVVFGP